MDAIITRKETILANPNLGPLSMDQLRKHVPAIFATEPHKAVSERYGFASTAKVLQALEHEGFVTVEARSFNRHNPKLRSSAKHMLRLRHSGDVKKLIVAGEVVPQVVLINSHDRSSRFRLYAGMFRFICSNGIIVSTGESIEPVIVRHTIHVIDEVMESIHRIAAEAGKVTGIIREMQHVNLTHKQQLAFARQAGIIRWPINHMSVEPGNILQARRKEDEGDNVWKVYNRVQENLVKGGIERVTATGRIAQSQPTVSIAADMSVNAGLWELAMATIRKAQSSSKKGK